MNVVFALVIGWLYAMGVYMLLRRSIVKLIFGLGLLGHATNLLIFSMGRLNREQLPMIPEGAKELTGSFADPLPQALILTAIVIGFGVQAFAVVLVKQVYETTGTSDLEKIRLTDKM